MKIQSRADGAPRAPLTSGNLGTNQTDVRSYNERLILQLLRWNGAMTKSEVGTATNLSPNSTSVIMRSLVEAGLALKEAPIRGRIGQPSTPFRINPSARHYLGLKVGRRSADLVVIDFVGTVLAQRCVHYAYPEPDHIRLFLESALREVLSEAGVNRSAVAGFGIAIPSEIWSWSAEIGVAPGLLDIWRKVDPASLLPRGSPWTPIVINDATAACLAETALRQRGDLQDAMYLFVGTLIGGGIMLNGSVFVGRTGTAGGFGPFRIPDGRPGADRLIDRASLIQLADAAATRGATDPTDLDALCEAYPDLVDGWVEAAAGGIAQTIVSSLTVIDFQAAIIDGALPPALRGRLVQRIREIFASLDRQGVVDPSITEGHFGAIARAVGAATLPLSRTYSIDQNNLLRERQ
jgi:predicted NBD/HSP70 family sugar kinase